MLESQVQNVAHCVIRLLDLLSPGLYTGAISVLQLGEKKPNRLHGVIKYHSNESMR